MSDSHLRSIVKAGSYRALGSATTIGVSYLVTGNLQVSSFIGGLDFISKIALYYAHERIWARIPSGNNSGLETKLNKNMNEHG